jgi:hypothetical protein
MKSTRLVTRPAAGLALLGLAAIALWANPTSAQSTPAMKGMQGMEGMHKAAASSDVPADPHARAALHGGQVTMTKAHHFETVFAPDGVRIYMYSAKLDPVPMDGILGTVTFKDKSGSAREVKLIPDAPQEGVEDVYYCTMYDSPPTHAPGRCSGCGMNLVRQNGLFAAADLSKAQPNALEATVHLTRIGGAEKEATFTSTYTGASEEAAPAADETTAPKEKNADR